MRILHLADVHLDRPFVAMPHEAARQRRAELRDAFTRCLDAARERKADAVTIGGDLWEDEHVTPDTRHRVAEGLEQLGLPVLIVCGNHDPLLPGGEYERTPWPSNVRVFRDEEPAEERLGEVSVWGVSWGGGQLTAGFLDTFRAPADGRTHLLLLHGTAQPVLHLAQSAHCPFEPARVRARGFALCIGGHVHAATELEDVVYPGSPEPLGWGDRGRHCYALVEIADGTVRVELTDVNRRRYDVCEIDCAGATSSLQVEQRLAEQLLPPDASLCLRAVLVGEVERECAVERARLVNLHGSRYGLLEIDDRTRPAHDLGALSSQRTVVGLFVRKLRNRLEAATDGAEREVIHLALQAGLRSLEGRTDLVDVG